MNQNPELRPCPFCGSSDLEIFDEVLTGETEPVYWVGCNACGGDGGMTADIASAIRLWNRRAEDCQVNVFDRVEYHENCTVQILTNTVTGDVSVGWWENEVDK